MSHMSCVYGKVQYGICGSDALSPAGSHVRSADLQFACLQLWCEKGAFPPEVQGFVTRRSPLPSLERKGAILVS